jgi:DNA-binding XRE family transcriptional regulator
MVTARATGRLRVKYGYTDGDTKFFAKVAGRKGEVEVPAPIGRWCRPPFDVEVDYDWGKAEARRLMELLISARKTQNTPAVYIAEKMGVQPEILYRLEGTNRDPKLSTAIRYARAIGIDFQLVEVE